MKLKIFKKNKTAYLIILLAITFLIFSILLGNLLSDKTPHKNIYVGISLAITVLLFLRIKIGLPIEQSGYISIENDKIIIFRSKNITQIDLNEIKQIEIKITGTYMELKKNWNITSKEIFPYDQGIDNEITIISKNNNYISENFYLSSMKNQEDLEKLLSKITNLNNINLKVKK